MFIYYSILEKNAVVFFHFIKIRKSIELGASALLFLCINNTDQNDDVLTATTETAAATAGENEFPVFLVDAIDNVSAVIEFLGNHLITKAKIHSCNDHTVSTQANVCPKYSFFLVITIHNTMV